MQEPYKSVWTELLDTPFRQAWIDAGGLKTRFVQAGDPAHPPLVLLHGTAGSLENFAANIAAHARHFNCIAFDMIGSGMTDKPDFDYETDHYVKHAVDFLNAMGIKKASVIGLSLGARVASRLAIDYPDKVEKLILLSATAYFPAKPIQDDIKRSRSAAAANPTWDSIVEIFKGLFHEPGKVWDDLIATRLSIYRRADMKAILNAAIKKRESFRPFAPSVLAEEASQWFEADGDSPFMSRVVPVRPSRRARVPAITHVDGSARPQTVDASVHPRFHALISAFRDLTGVPMLLNTSFNENEPIVRTPEEAVDCFARTNMDLLVLGDFVVQREAVDARPRRTVV